MLLPKMFFVYIFSYTSFKIQMSSAKSCTIEILCTQTLTNQRNYREHWSSAAFFNCFYFVLGFCDSHQLHRGTSCIHATIQHSGHHMASVLVLLHSLYHMKDVPSAVQHSSCRRRQCSAFRQVLGFHVLRSFLFSAFLFNTAYGDSSH